MNSDSKYDSMAPVTQWTAPLVYQIVGRKYAAQKSCKKFAEETTLSFTGVPKHFRWFTPTHLRRKRGINNWLQKNFCYIYRYC